MIERDSGNDNGFQIVIQQEQANLTDSLVTFLAEPWASPPPEDAIQTALDGFTDAVAVMVAGRTEPVTQNLWRYLSDQAAPAESRLLLGKQRSSASLAALLGTAAAHALDFDDYAYSNHVSALLVPAILADAERCGASGQAMVEAYLAGFEVWGTVFKREPDHLHSKGWHPTGVFGPIGVAAAICRLRKLDATTCRNALGLAVTQGGGVMDNFGTQAKPYQGARASQAGVVSVELAIAGIDAGAHALDGSGGLMAALSPGQKVDRESAATQLGKEWMAARGSLNIKRHPTVGASQRAIDAAIQLHQDYQPKPENIQKVIARVSEKHAAVMRLHRPQNASEARFSLEFGVATGLLKGRVGLAELQDEWVQSEPLQALVQKVAIEIGPDDDPSYPVGARFDTVRVELKEGSALESEPVFRFRGHGENPMNLAELKEKFESCVVSQLGVEQAEKLFLTLRNLPTLSGTEEIETLEFRSP